MFGNWIGVTHSIKTLPLLVMSAGIWGQQKAANRLIRIVRGHLFAQDLGWQQLSSDTIRQKQGTAVLLDSYTYQRSIKTWRKGLTRYTGVPADAYYPDGTSVALVATIHEWRSYNGGPYRALWGPSIDEMGGAAGIASIVAVAIQSKIRRMRYKGFDTT